MKRIVPELVVAGVIIAWFPATMLVGFVVAAVLRALIVLLHVGASVALPVATGIVPTVVLGAMLYVLLGLAPRWVERWQLPALAERALERPNRNSSPVLFPVTIAVSLLADVTVLSVPVADSTLFIFMGVGVALLLFSLFYHRLPNHNRRLKYETAQIAFALWVLAVAVGDHWGVLLLIDSFAVPLWVAALSLAARSYMPPSPQSGLATPSAMRAYRLTMTWGPGSGVLHFLAWLVVRVTSFTFHGYMVVRYVAKERMSSRPALYFRSFHHPHIGPLFGKLLAPTVGRRLVLEPLVHRAQLAAAIYRKAHPGWHGRALVLPDEGWQARVEEKLHDCSVVLIDVTVPTETLAWEIQTALEIVPHERIACVLPRGAARSLPRSIAVLEYDPSKPGDGRDAVNQWIDRVCDRLSGAQRATGSERAA
jgi:hypothetical protein